MTDLLRAQIAGRGWLLADGATGTNLFAAGLPSGEAPELWNLERPDAVLALHRDFVAAGADLILTNSFGGTANRLRLHGAEGRVHEINSRAAELARQAADAAGRTVLVAGSMGPTGDLYQPLGPLNVADGAAAYAEQAAALAAGGVDLLWIESLNALDEMRAAIAGAATTGLPSAVTFCFDLNGRTMMGVTPAAFADAVTTLSPAPVAIGVNCGTGAPDLMAALLEIRDRVAPGTVLIAKANNGMPVWRENAVSYPGTAASMARYAILARDSGAAAIGGCCGTTPAHLAAMRAALEATPPGPSPDLDTILAELGPLTYEAAVPRPGGGRGPRRRGKACC